MANPLLRLITGLRENGLLGVFGKPVDAVVDRRKQSRRATGQKGTLIWDDAAGQRHMEQARVRDDSAYGIGLSVTAPVPVGQTVWLEPTSGPLVKGVIRYSESGGGEYLVGLIRVHTERRRVDRQPVQGTGTLDWYAQGAQQASAPVDVLNATEFGLQLRVPTKVPVLLVARLSGKLMGCEGTICYCVPAKRGYLVGFHFTHLPYQTASLDYAEAS